MSTGHVRDNGRIRLESSKSEQPELRHFGVVPVPTAYQGHADFKLRVTEPVDLSSLGHVGGRDHSCGRYETGPWLGYPVAILLGGGEWCGHQDAGQNHCRKAPSRYGCRIHEPLVGGKEPHDSSKMPTKRTARRRTRSDTALVVSSRQNATRN